MFLFFLQCTDRSVATSAANAPKSGSSHRLALALALAIRFRPEGTQLCKTHLCNHQGDLGRMGGDRRRPLNIERSFGIRLGIQNAVHFLPVDGSKNSPTLHRRVNGAERAANG